MAAAEALLRSLSLSLHPDPSILSSPSRLLPLLPYPRLASPRHDRRHLPTRRVVVGWQDGSILLLLLR